MSISLGFFLGVFGPDSCIDGWRAQDGVKSCAELLLGLVMEQESFPSLVVPRQAGTHCLHPGSAGMGAQCPGTTMCSAPRAALGCSLGGGSVSHENGSFPKA